MIEAKDEEQLHDEAEELRKETADGAPEVAENVVRHSCTILKSAVSRSRGRRPMSSGMSSPTRILLR